MAKFPIERAPERIEAAPLPRAALDVDVGGVGEAVAGLGASIAAIGEKFQQAKDMTDMTESETTMLVQFDQLESNYALDVDYSTMLSRWSKDADKIPDSLNKNVSGRVKRAREALYLKYRRQYAVKINDSARGLQISDGRAKHDEGLDTILRTGGRFAPDRAEALIRGTAAAGYISAEEAQRDRARILPEIAWYSALDMIKAQPEDVEDIITLHPDLELSMKDRLRASAKDIITQRQLAVEQEYWQLLRGGRLAELQIRIDDPASPLPVSRKSWWTEQVKSHITGGDHDPAVYWPLLRKSMKYPNRVTEEEIAGKVGKGINTDDYKEIMRLVEKEGPLQTPRAQIYFGELDNLFKDGILNPLEYDTKNQKLTEFFEANPDATAKQASEFFEESIKEEKSSWVWNLLTKSFGKWKKSPFGAPYRWLTEEPEVEPETLKVFEDNVQSLAATDEDKARDYYNSWVGKFEGKEFGLRPDKTPKGKGFLGVLQLKGGGVATEYSFGTTDVTGKEMDIPSLVPTLTQKEVEIMVNDIIPNRKPVPKEIFQKAVAHAKKRLEQGKSVYAE